MNTNPDSKTLNDVLIEEISELYSVETQFLKTLPKMAELANDHELKALFLEYYNQASQQLERLRRAAEILGTSLASRHQPPMARFIESIGLDCAEPGIAMDARLICVAHKVESYQKAGSLGVCTFAQMLGFDEVANLLLLRKSGLAAN